MEIILGYRKRYFSLAVQVPSSSVFPSLHDDWLRHLSCFARKYGHLASLRAKQPLLSLSICITLPLKKEHDILHRVMVFLKVSSIQLVVVVVFVVAAVLLIPVVLVSVGMKRKLAL